MIVLFVVIQFIPVNTNNPSSDENLELKAPVAVKNILLNSCYDCHSNKTNWPFYSKIAPVSWLVSSDVSNGRNRLNFSEWFTLSEQVRARKKAGMIEEIMDNEMPLALYTFIHPDSKLSDEQKQILKNWTVSKNGD
ncbi:MAG: heme-binding protein [Calditrichales bacterium]|nr:MAG: heme-binding protein [Calditrichales bacterium]